MSEILTESIENYALSVKEKPKVLFSHVGIIGCGTTGQRIALMIASRGIEVVFLELSDEKIKEAYEELDEQLTKRINHWGMTKNEKKLILSRINGTTKYEDLSECDLVLDAILSKIREHSIEERKAVFKRIEQNVNVHTIIATNSTSTVITELASELEHKERCVSMHFSTTAPAARVVEVVMGIYTTPGVIKDVKKFAKLINKDAIMVEESPGLVSVRLGVALIGEACDILMEGVSSKEDIDYVMKNGLRLPLGPFEMADKIGIDRVFRWMENLYNEFGDKKYKASPIIKKLVRAKHFGRKTCEGFYKYDEHGNKLKDQTKQINCPHI